MLSRFSAVALVAGALTLGGCDSSVSPISLRSPESSEPSFILRGSTDGNKHPAVILIVMDSAGAPAYRCSGTLLSPKIVLTAGHCTGEPGEFTGMRVFTESDVQNGVNNYPTSGPNTIEAKAWHTHPQFTEALFYLHDVGVIELRTGVSLPASAYGVLPGLNSLDALTAGSTTTFTSVGYGMQKSTGSEVSSIAEKIRMFAEPYLKGINTNSTGTYSLLLSNNGSTGGTCFGDSGGPNFLGSGKVIAGVTSYSRSGNCGGAGGVFRLDRKDVLDFVSQYLK